ncbi:uncharacterized protein SCHCODRAFT_02059558 [Schizophyllum commune H4-8]|uniref:uncharacterized protein n=1 Tax=Schizophyllum commune (strain H4-8 / FGSC 9210) TaxID=578458 RepID=UPI002160254A|nr:uncharacterized protein SCHCODRAFT_02059558 [Schizophyllum commune H4-8]KAI5888657.1 hypothetical protein SCHCODRAFT_02059558 [Schizophyllum commune H4-8]
MHAKIVILQVGEIKLYLMNPSFALKPSRCPSPRPSTPPRALRTRSHSPCVKVNLTRNKPPHPQLSDTAPLHRRAHPSDNPRAPSGGLKGPPSRTRTLPPYILHPRDRRRHTFGALTSTKSLSACLRRCSLRSTRGAGSAYPLSMSVSAPSAHATHPPLALLPQALLLIDPTRPLPRKWRRTLPGVGAEVGGNVNFNGAHTISANL